MKKVLIIGAGGIGSFLIPLLDRMGEYAMTVADPDSVEKKNLLYQNFYLCILTRTKHNVCKICILMWGGLLTLSNSNNEANGRI